MNAAELRLADEIIEIGNRMYNRGFVASNDGNISARCPDGSIIVTPTMVSKGGMTRDMLIRLTPDGEKLEGDRKASSEVKMHLRLYRENPEIMAVTHAHPTAATSFAIAGIPLDRPIYPEAAVNLGTVPVAPYARPGTDAVPDSIAPFCHDYRAVLLANHGALTWGKDLTEAWYRMESLENYAKITLNVYFILKKANELPPEEIKAVTGSH